MHEAYIARSIYDLAIKALEKDQNAPASKLGAKLSKVAKIKIKVGVLSHVQAESLQMYFDELAKMTPFQKAELVISVEPAKLVCKKCNNETVFTDKTPIQITCKKCGGQNELKGGDEFYLDSLEVED
jgi:hydrogenase nickel insertion protein HypA